MARRITVDETVKAVSSTALHLAAENSDIYTGCALQQHHASIKADYKGPTPHFAAKHGHVQVVKLLLTAGILDQKGRSARDLGQGKGQKGLYGT